MLKIWRLAWLNLALAPGAKICRDLKRDRDQQASRAAHPHEIIGKSGGRREASDAAEHNNNDGAQDETQRGASEGDRGCKANCCGFGRRTSVCAAGEEALVEGFEKDYESQGQARRVEDRDMGCAGEGRLYLQVTSRFGELADS